ncbi:hypothetical protein AGR1A_pAt20543 [Agrobacterium fabacearum CFBP 5771]|nr:hypothetical protein AGR1A_pAt20543 [Agrobacterium fabacearum CFBP 5771]
MKLDLSEERLLTERAARALDVLGLLNTAASRALSASKS